jgi:hypothetical protein
LIIVDAGPALSDTDETTAVAAQPVEPVRRRGLRATDSQSVQQDDQRSEEARAVHGSVAQSDPRTMGDAITKW